MKNSIELFSSFGVKMVKQDSVISALNLKLLIATLLLAKHIIGGDFVNRLKIVQGLRFFINSVNFYL